MYKIGLAEIKLINVVSSIMNKFLSFAKQALYFAGRAAVAGVLPAIGLHQTTTTIGIRLFLQFRLSILKFLLTHYQLSYLLS